MTRSVVWVLAAAVLLSGLPGCRRDEGREPAGRASAAAPLREAPLRPRKGPIAQKVLYEQAKGFLQSGRAREAAEHFGRAIEAHGRGDLLASCYLGLGSAQAELGERDGAVAAYRKVVELRPDDPDGHRALAMGLEEAGKRAEAAAALERALELEPFSLSTYQDLAGVHLRGKDVERAKQAYQRYEERRTTLIHALGLDKDPDERAAAAEALGEARDEATVKALGLALTDRDRRVRLAVAAALGRQGLAGGAGPLRALLARTRDAAERKAAEAALEAIAGAEQPAPEPVPEPEPEPGK